MNGNSDLTQELQSRRPNVTPRHEPEVLRANAQARREAAMRRVLVAAAIITGLAYTALTAYWIVPAIVHRAGF